MKVRVDSSRLDSWSGAEPHFNRIVDSFTLLD